MNQKKLRRLCREEKLQVRKRGGRKRALGTRRPMPVPERPNERWSLDFVSDAFTPSRQIASQSPARQWIQNGFVESFNGSFRDELLNEMLFSTLSAARAKITAWTEDYNRIGPHSSLSNLTPVEFAMKARLEMTAA